MGALSTNGIFAPLSPIGRGRVLIVDDDEVAARSMARVLLREGHEIDVATCPIAALSYMECASYHAVVTDLCMPTMDGAALIAQGRQLLQHTTFVVVTGKPNPEEHLRRVGEDSVLGVLSKPFAATDLVDTVRRAVMASRGSNPGEQEKRSLLLIEDSRVQAAAIAGQLEKGCPEYVATCARSLSAGLELLAHQQFDLALTDLNLPDARGLDAVRRLLGATPNLPVIAMSQSLLPSIGSLALEVGASDYLPKEDLSPSLLRRSFDQAHVRQIARRHLEELAFKDSLTGVSNGRHLHDRLCRAVSLAKRHDRSSALVFIDLDGFKPINDTLGHHAGDLVLQVVARRMQNELRESDTLARIGGDEFAVLLEDVGSGLEATVIARRLLQAVAEPIRVGRAECRVSASAGVTLFCDGRLNPDQLLRLSDTTMYRAKASGPGRMLLTKTRPSTLPPSPSTPPPSTSTRPLPSTPASAPSLRPSRIPA